MKSKPNAVLLLAALLIAAAGGVAGWIGRGLFTGRASSQPATAPPTAEISRTGSSSAASPSSQNSGAGSTEEPRALARRMLQAVLDGTQEGENRDLLRLRFRTALAGCDEASIAEMAEILMRRNKDRETQGLGSGPIAGDFGTCLTVQMAGFNPQKALDYHVAFMVNGMSSGPTVFSMIMELLADQNPAYAQNVIEGLPPGQVRTAAELAWWQARIKTDPEGVFQSLMNLDSEARKLTSSYSKPLQELLEKLALQAPEKALQAATLLQGDPFYSNREHLARAWIERDPKAAVQWAMEQNDAETLRLFLLNVPPEGRNLDEKSVRDNFLAISSKKPEGRAYLAGDLAAHLAEQDLPESVRWAATLPADARDAANLAVAKAWIKQDVPAAAEWLTTWPAGSAKDEAVEVLAYAIVEDDPESALTWAASIQAKERFSLMQRALKTLTGKDPAAAERAMQTLSEEDRTVLSVMKRTGLGE